MTDAGCVVNILTIYRQNLVKSREINCLDLGNKRAYNHHPKDAYNANPRVAERRTGKKELTMQTLKSSIPYIDPNVQFVGVSKLRQLNATALNDLDNKTLVIQENDKPLAVVLSYDQFLEMQKERERVKSTLEMLMSADDRAALVNSLQEMVERKTKPISEIREALKQKKNR